MLFSELNRINFNVLIQDPTYEVVPDISADCYIHNKDEWTKYVEKFYADPDDTIIAFPDQKDEDKDGWKLKELGSDNLEDRYLYHALDDISKTLKVKTEPDSDLVKIYAGQFDANGTIDYAALIEDDFEFHPRHFYPCHPHRGEWWTFSNGAFQWIGGWPTSIFECRFSYGPFCGVDPHHFDNNHEMLDRFNSLSILPNLIFVFDEMHVLKGIISLPCGTDDLVGMTQNFIRGFLGYAQTKHEMSFANLDKILQEYSQIDGYIPTIKVAHKHEKPKSESKPLIAIFDIAQSNLNLEPEGTYKYILPNKNTMSGFLAKSRWKSYKIDMSIHIPYYGPIGKFKPPPYEPLDEYSTMEDIEEHVNDLQGSIATEYQQFVRYNFITTLSERFITKPINVNEEASTALLTISDIFKYAKEIKKIKEEAKFEFKTVVLPENFCDKRTLSFITNVRYPELS